MLPSFPTQSRIRKSPRKRALGNWKERKDSWRQLAYPAEAASTKGTRQRWTLSRRDADLHHSGTVYSLLLATVGRLLLYGMESVTGPIMQLKFKTLDASNTEIGLILGTIPGIVYTVLNPVISFRSDRFRSRWGRRNSFHNVFFAIFSALPYRLGFWRPNRFMDSWAPGLSAEGSFRQSGADRNPWRVAGHLHVLQHVRHLDLLVSL